MISSGSLCTGYGGLDLAVVEVFGARAAWHAENDPDAAAVLAAHWPDVPNHGDLTTVDWSAVEPVDVLTAGWPCQPWSTAGKRRGVNDDRAIWPHIAHAIRVVRPSLAILENVPGILAAGELARATADLAALGYVGSWRCVRAADVGAPHRRERVFIVAHPEGAGLETWREGRSGGRAAADADRSAVWQQPVRLAWGRRAPVIGDAGEGVEVALLPSPRATDGTKGGPNQRGSSGDLMLPSAVLHHWGAYAPAVARWGHVIGRPAPDPTEPGRNGQPRLSPRFVEWLMGLPAGWVTDHTGRNPALRILGNGVVPQQAALALSLLLSTLEVAA